VKAQLNALLGSINALAASAVRTNAANVFSAVQTVNGAAGDVNPALQTTSGPATRKLLWDIAGAAGSFNYRLYAASLAFELTVNARWDGTQWVKDSPVPSSKLELGNAELRLRSDDAVVTPFPDVWPSTVTIGIGAHGQQSFDGGGNWTSSGPTETYVGYHGPTSSQGEVNVGAAASFRKIFSRTPSSITFQVLNSTNLGGGLTPIEPTRSGTGVFGLPAVLGITTRFYALVFAA
jgi:hypothetical protein